MDMRNANYTIGLTRIPTMGKAIFFVRIMDSNVIRPARSYSHQFKSKELNETSGSHVQTLILTKNEIETK